MDQGAAPGLMLLFPLTLTVGVLMGYYYPELRFVQIVNLLMLVVLGGVLMIDDSAPPLIAPVFLVCTGLIIVQQKPYGRKVNLKDLLVENAIQRIQQ
jgi:hypothetical protein